MLFDDLKHSARGQHIKAAEFSFSPETYGGRTFAHTELVQSYIRQPFGQGGIHIKNVLVRVGIQSKDCPQKMKDTGCRPSLRHVGAQVLHWETLLLSLNSGIEFRQPMEGKIT